MAQQSSAPAVGNQAQQSSAHAAGNQAPAPAESSKTAILNAYGDRLNNLGKERREIEKDIARIINKINQLNLSDRSPAPDVVPTDVQVIAFVKALERAYEFFKFKDHLERNVRFIKHNSDRIKCFRSLVKYKRVQDTFKNLNFQDILDAVEERILDLQIEKDKLAINNFSKNSKEDKKPFTLNKYERYVMDKDPNVELDLMKKHNPDFHEHFIRGLLEKFSEKTVKVYNVPVLLVEKEVKELFQDCGRIESIKFHEFEDYWSKFAYVTFKTSEGAKLAPILMSESVYLVNPLREPSECRSYSGSERSQALRMYETFRDPTRSSKESPSSSNGK